MQESLSDRIIQCWCSGISCPDLRNRADAAPELLEALKEMVERFESFEGTTDQCMGKIATWDKASVAIAKAEGK